MRHGAFPHRLESRSTLFHHHRLIGQRGGQEVPHPGEIVELHPLTTDSLAPIWQCLATSASSTGSVTASPWNQISPVSSSTNTAGHWLSGVSGVIPTKLSRITASSIEGVPKWVFLVDGNPGTEGWLVHAVDRQDKQPALSLAPFSTLCRYRHNADYAEQRIMPTRAGRACSPAVSGRKVSA